VEPGTLIEGDEPVFTQGYELDGEAGLYPPGMLIGQVSRLVPADNATQEYVEVRPAVDFETLQFVLVLQARTEA
jgi:cell shape-determining protein MreC